MYSKGPGMKSPLLDLADGDHEPVACYKPNFPLKIVGRVTWSGGEQNKPL